MAERRDGGRQGDGGTAGGGSAPPQRAPEKGGGEVERDAGGKIGEERGDHENEAGNAPREEPGAGERR